MPLIEKCIIYGNSTKERIIFIKKWSIKYVMKHMVVEESVYVIILSGKGGVKFVLEYKKHG